MSFQVCLFLGVLKSRHYSTVTCGTALLQTENNLQLAVEFYCSGSTVFVQSLWELFDSTTSI